MHGVGDQCSYRSTKTRNRTRSRILPKLFREITPVESKSTIKADAQESPTSSIDVPSIILQNRFSLWALDEIGDSHLPLSAGSPNDLSMTLYVYHLFTDLLSTLSIAEFFISFIGSNT
jgi:hypothetical protein